MRPSDAVKHSKSADMPAKAAKWAAIANSVLKKNHDEGMAIRVANDVIKGKTGLIMRSQNATTNKREHITNGSECWCWPEIEILGDGMKMFTHRDMNATKTGTEQ